MKALQKMRLEMDEVKARARKTLARVKETVGDPKKAAIYLILGIVVGFAAPHFLGKNFDRSKRRYVRLAMGAALILFGRKKRELLLLGIGILGSEIVASGLEYAGPMIGMSTKEIGALESGNRSAGSLPPWHRFAESNNSAVGQEAAI